MNREGRNWPGYIFGGRMRTSTLVLIIAFVGIGWLYETYEPPAGAPEQVPASEVVPPGFIPDPAYTWAPRTDVQRHTPTPTTTETTETTSTTPSTTPTSPTTPTTSTPATTPTSPTSPASVPTGSPTVTTSVSPQPASTSASAATPPPPATPVPSSAVRPG